MLDEKEYQIISEIWRQCGLAPKEWRLKHNLPLENLSFEERFRPMLNKYQELTEFEETNHIAILHHRLSIYGEPCENCRKPLRTPKANFCAACGKIPSKSSEN